MRKGCARAHVQIGPHLTRVRLTEWVPSHTPNFNTILQAVREIWKRGVHVRTCKCIPSLTCVKLLFLSNGSLVVVPIGHLCFLSQFLSNSKLGFGWNKPDFFLGNHRNTRPTVIPFLSKHMIFMDSLILSFQGYLIVKPRNTKSLGVVLYVTADMMESDASFFA